MMDLQRNVAVGHGLRFPILIVEDSDDDYEATARTFQKDGDVSHPLIRCESGDEALDYLYGRPPFDDAREFPQPGLILLDLNMPGRDGRSVLGTIKGDPLLRQIPVVVLTTSDNMRDVKDCYRIGANSYIKKPVDLEGLLRTIRLVKEYWLGLSLMPQGDNDV